MLLQWLEANVGAAHSARQQAVLTRTSTHILEFWPPPLVPKSAETRGKTQGYGLIVTGNLCVDLLLPATRLDQKTSRTQGLEIISGMCYKFIALKISLLLWWSYTSDCPMNAMRGNGRMASTEFFLSCRCGWPNRLEGKMVTMFFIVLLVILSFPTLFVRIGGLSTFFARNAKNVAPRAVFVCPLKTIKNAGRCYSGLSPNCDILQWGRTTRAFLARVHELCSRTSVFSWVVFLAGANTFQNPYIG